jgi:hypothetical protein
MRAIVTIFKDELKGKVYLLKQLDEMSDHVNIVGSAYIISPKPGKLFDILNELKENKIAYGTHFNTSRKM